MNEILRNKEQALRDTLEKYNTKSYFNPYEYLEAYKKHKGFDYELNLDYDRDCEECWDFVRKATKAIRIAFCDLYYSIH